MQQPPEKATAIQKARKKEMLREAGNQLSEIDINALPPRMRTIVKNSIQKRNELAPGDESIADQITEKLLEIPEVLAQIKQLKTTPEATSQQPKEAERDEKLDKIKRNVEPMIQLITKLLNISKTECNRGAPTQAVFESEDHDRVTAQILQISQQMDEAQTVKDVREVLDSFIQSFDTKLKPHIEKKLRFFNGPYFSNNAPDICRQQQRVYTGEPNKNNGVEDYIFAIKQELNK